MLNCPQMFALILVFRNNHNPSSTVKTVSGALALRHVQLRDEEKNIYCAFHQALVKNNGQLSL